MGESPGLHACGYLYTFKLLLAQKCMEVLHLGWRRMKVGCEGGIFWGSHIIWDWRHIVVSLEVYCRELTHPKEVASVLMVTVFSSTSG